MSYLPSGPCAKATAAVASSAIIPSSLVLEGTGLARRLFDGVGGGDLAEDALGRGHFGKVGGI